ncbi:MAG: leucyl aminopeptidase [Chlamydiota bacterium]
MSLYEIVAKRAEADILFIPYIEGKSLEESCEAAKELSKSFSSSGILEDFSGKEGEVAILYPPLGQESRICLIGLGKNPSLSTFRDSYATAVRKCLPLGCQTANVLFPQIETPEDVLIACFEGLLLGNYLFKKYKTHKDQKQKESLFSQFSLVTKTSSQQLDEQCEIASSIYFTRDLVNTNADEITPAKLADIAIDMGKTRKNLRVEVLDKQEIEKLGMGLLLAVNRGCSHEPKLIVFHYEGDPSSSRKAAFIGKGVTYDTGGLSLKPTQFMNGMKADMGGAASVFGLIDALSRLQVKKNVIGVVPTTENGIDANSYKVGDIYTSYLGKTVEIDNTDAEGRLILADALSYTAKNYKPDFMVDLATLTGAIVIALGEDYTGVFSNNRALEEALQQASSRQGENFWAMPLHQKYFSLLKSDFADTKNSGSREASSITAALFLKEFIEELPWAHLDIAGCAFRSKESGAHPKNASGEPVRTLVEFVRSLEENTWKEIGQ